MYINNYANCLKVSKETRVKINIYEQTDWSTNMLTKVHCHFILGDLHILELASRTSYYGTVILYFWLLRTTFISFVLFSYDNIPKYIYKSNVCVYVRANFVRNFKATKF